MPTKKLAIIAMLVAQAAVLHFLESLLPNPIPIPGVKLGLANIIALLALLLFDFKTAMQITVLRTILGSLLSGLSGTAVVDHQLGRFCESIPDSLRARYASADDRARMRGLVETALRSLLARSWHDLLDTRTPGVMERHVHALLNAEALRDIVRQGLARVASSVIETLQRGTLADAAGMMTAGGDVTAYLDWLAHTLHAALLAADIRPRLETQAFEAVRRLCASPVRPPINFLPEDTVPRLADLIAQQRNHLLALMAVNGTIAALAIAAVQLV